MAFRLFSRAAWNADEVGRILPVQLLAAFVPGSRDWLVADATLCHERGAEVAFGGIYRDAVLSTKKLPPPDCQDERRKKGEDWTTPAKAFDDASIPWQEVTAQLPGGQKKLMVKVIGPCCRYSSEGAMPLDVVLVRDPDEKWRDEALPRGDLELSAAEAIVGYRRRWSVEVAYRESRRQMGLQAWFRNNDPKSQQFCTFREIRRLGHSLEECSSR